MNSTTLQVGSLVKVSWQCHGEAVFDRRGKPVHMSPTKLSATGTVYYIGPELPDSVSPSATVVKCRSAGSVGFNFYPDDSKDSQKFEVLNYPATKEKS